MSVSTKPRNHEGRQRAKQNWIDAGRHVDGYHAPSPAAEAAIAAYAPKVEPVQKKGLDKVLHSVKSFFQSRRGR